MKIKKTSKWPYVEYSAGQDTKPFLTVVDRVPFVTVDYGRLQVISIRLPRHEAARILQTVRKNQGI